MPPRTKIIILTFVYAFLVNAFSSSILHVTALDVEGCLTYRWQPREKPGFHVSNSSIQRTPKPPLGCEKLRKYKDEVEVGYVVVDPLHDTNEFVTELKAVVGGNDERAMEEKELIVIIEDEAPGKPSGGGLLHSLGEKAHDEKRHAEIWTNTLKGDNHYLVYSSSVLGRARSWNRGATMAHAAKYVVLTTGHSLHAATPDWVANAISLMEERKSMVLVGGRAYGKLMASSDKKSSSGSWFGRKRNLLEEMDEEDEEDEEEREDGVTQRSDGSSMERLGATFTPGLSSDAPVVVRRQAFVNLGRFARTMCPKKGACQGNVVEELAARAWLAGYETALLPTDKDTKEEVSCSETLTNDVLSSTDIETIARRVKGASSVDGNDLPVVPFPIGEEDEMAANLWFDYAPIQGKCRPLAEPEDAWTVENCKEIDDADAALMIQYYKRPKNINEIIKGVRLVPEKVEVIIINDSESDHWLWRKQLDRPGDFLIYMHNNHEIRAYNRASLFANSNMLVTLQDDDVPTGTKWLTQALALFESHPKLTFLSGYRARGGFPGGNYGLGRGKIPTTDKKANVPFMFAYKLVAGPLFYRRDVFMRTGMFMLLFSCAGDPGIHFEYEYSLRTWYYEYQAGLYTCNFKHHVGDWKSSGTRASKEKEARRRLVGVRNSQNVRFMYKGLAGGGKEGKLLVRAGAIQKIFASGKPTNVVI